MAFVRLYALHERRVFAYVLSLVTNFDDANDVVQETCVRLWEQFDEFDSQRDFGAWACSIAYYQVLSMRKKLRTGKLQFGELFYEAIAREAIPAIAQLDDRQRAMNECLEKLHPPQREFLRLCYCGDLSFKDVANRMNRTLSSTYSLLFRIRRLLQDCIQKNLARDA